MKILERGWLQFTIGHLLVGQKLKRKSSQHGMRQNDGDFMANGFPLVSRSNINVFPTFSRPCALV